MHLKDRKKGDLCAKPPDNTLDFEKVEKLFIFKQTKELNDIVMPEGVKSVNLGAFIREVYNLINTDIMNKIIPEAYPLLRTLQLTKWAKSDVIKK